jgi:hypothetical protein
MGKVELFLEPYKYPGHSNGFRGENKKEGSNHVKECFSETTRPLQERVNTAY